MEIRNGRIRPTVAQSGGDKATIETSEVKAFTIAFDAPTPKVPLVSWACAGLDPDLFHPTDSDGLAIAQAVCAGCEMKLVCLRLATERSEYGVWGGVLFENGKQRDTPRKMGRPKKAVA